MHFTPDQPVTLGKTPRDDVNAATFQAAYGVTLDAFRVILIGYDQGEKLRQTEVDIDRLFAEIDQMPMRQHEMR